MLRPDLLQQALQGVGFDQWYVTVKDQHALGRQIRQRLGYSMAGSQLLGLNDEGEIIAGQSLAHLLGTVANNHLDAFRLQCTRGVDHVPEHGFSGDRMQNLGQRRTHARALASGENDDIERHEAIPERYRPVSSPVHKSAAGISADRWQKKKKGSQGYPFTRAR